MVSAKLLPGLPSYGEAAIAFPPEWARLGREGAVVEFRTESDLWIGNFKPGLAGLEIVAVHPNKEDAVVIASGDLWVVSPTKRTAMLVLPAIDAAFDVHDPEGWVFSRQGIALARLGSVGLIWHTRRLSWDGFDRLEIIDGEIRGLAWTPLGESWHPFRVDLRSGRAVGGSYSDDDTEGWEALAI
jgi:hypothetical protein